MTKAEEYAKRVAEARASHPEAFVLERGGRRDLCITVSPEGDMDVNLPTNRMSPAEALRLAAWIKKVFE